MNARGLRIGIYTPYLHICGGGEKFVGMIAGLLSRDHRVEFIVTDDVDLGRVQARLNLDLSRVGLRRVPLEMPLSGPAVRYFRKWAQVRGVSAVTAEYDLFINQETLSSIPCRAGRGVFICQAPPRRFNPTTSLSDNLLRIAMARLLFDARLETYQKVIVYSDFVARWARPFYRREPVVLYPAVDVAQFTPLPKQDILLSVGRFFVGLHDKKQLEQIRAFKTLYDVHPELNGWEYHLAGGVDPEDRAQAYAAQCQAEAAGYPIVFHLNASFADLQNLYGRAKLFWHAAGLGEEENRHPERIEHFGITTIEAMAAGCVPLVINKGGQPEIVRHEADGLCWNTLDELCQATLRLIRDPAALATMRASSLARSQDFGAERFARAVRRTLEL